MTQQDIIKAKSTNGDTMLDVEIYCTTGPILITQSYIDFSNKADVALLKTYPFRAERFGKYARHYCMGTWRK